MAIFHVSTSTPTKAEILAAWVPGQAWSPNGSDPIEILGSFHFDDPEGCAGMETHLVRVGESLFQVPLTYRDAPLEQIAPVATMEHSVLGTRWVYDGLDDHRYVMILAGVALTGQGQSLGWARHEGRWYAAPSGVSLGHRGDRLDAPTPLDGLSLDADHGDHVVFRRGRFELTFFRRLGPTTDDSMGLTATWGGQPHPVLLATAVRRN